MPPEETALQIPTVFPLAKVDLHEPQWYLNRELSWLAFNERVLEEAEDLTNPLLERLKFLAIFSSNLDEFFQVRVAGIKEQVKAGVGEVTPDGLDAQEELIAIGKRCRELVDRQYRCLRESVLPALAENGVLLRTGHRLTDRDCMELLEFFRKQVFPTITPMAVDPAHPFPHVPNKALCLAVILDDPRSDVTERKFAIVPVPGVLARMVPLSTLAPLETGDDRPTERAFTLLGEVITRHLSEFFCGLHVVEVAPFRVTRNTEMYLDEDDTDDLLAAIESELRTRNRGAAVRLEISEQASEEVVARLTGPLGLTTEDVYRINGPIDLTFAWKIVGLPGFKELRDPPYTPQPVIAFGELASNNPADFFDRIRAGDVLVHHPYESFSCVTDFLNAAVDDPAVLAIKQTLYRTAKDSPVLAALERAAQNGKQVTALMELKARFDEENNIQWAKRLEAAGVHVVYGLVGLKTHCKVALVIRREEGGIRQYVHLSTGNYNHVTSRLYTDIGLFTADAEMGQDASALFNMLTGYSLVSNWNRLCVAPTDMHQRVCAWIEREIAKHERHGEGRIIMKCNSIVESKVIRRLYMASRAGVQVDLIIRGICCLRPGVPGVSENIRVRSIVDRFLEHSRIFYFRNGGQEEFWLGSADLMPRNLFKRVEVLFPLIDPGLRKRVLKEILAANLKDNVRARLMHPDGTYERAKPGQGKPFRMQFWLARRAAKMVRRNVLEKVPSAPKPGLFVPADPPQAMTNAPRRKKGK